MDKDIKASVILATCNGERYIRHAIESVLAQTYQSFELIIADDGSTDDTRAVALSYAERDARVRVMSQKNAGPGIARNMAMKEAKGAYIAFIDDDDIWNDANKLKVQVEFLESHEEYVLVGCMRTRLIDEGGAEKGYAFLPDQDAEIRKTFLSRNCFFTSAVLFRKDKALEAGGFKDMRLAEDYDLWLRLGTLGKLANLPVEISYRQRASSVSGQKKLEMYKRVSAVISWHKHEYPNYWLGSIKARLRILHFYLFKS